MRVACRVDPSKKQLVDSNWQNPKMHVLNRARHVLRAEEGQLLYGSSELWASCGAHAEAASCSRKCSALGIDVSVASETWRRSLWLRSLTTSATKPV